MPVCETCSREGHTCDAGKCKGCGYPTMYKLCAGCSTTLGLCMYCGVTQVAVTPPPPPPVAVVHHPPPRMMGSIAPPIHRPPIMPPIRGDPIPPPLPPDPFTQNREWAVIFQAAGFTEAQLQFPLVRLAILRQVHRNSSPPEHMPSTSSIPDKAFLITDLGNLRTRIDRNLPKLRCRSGHSLSAKSPAQLTDENSGYSSGFHCDLCSVTYPDKRSMHCSICQFDMCEKCGLNLLEG